MPNSLGRGLSSLIPQKVKKAAVTPSGEVVVSVISEIDKNKILQISPEKIGKNPSQPRRNFNQRELEELAESIKQYGMIQPLVATRKNGEYELIAGERRLRAAKLLKLETVPVIVRQADEQERLELALVENLQREDLNPIEEAMAYRKLLDEFNLTQDELAARVGKARPTVTNTLRFLHLPEQIQQALIDGRLVLGQAKILAGLDSEAKQLALFKKIMVNKLTTNDAYKESRAMGGTKMARIKINYADKDKEFAFRQYFGTKAEIKRKGHGGEVVLYFYSDEELGEMVAKIKRR